MSFNPIHPKSGPGKPFFDKSRDTGIAKEKLDRIATQQDSRTDDLKRLNAQKLVSKNPLASQMVKGFRKSTIPLKSSSVDQVCIGVSFRIDGNGEAHTGHDMKAIEGINKFGESLRSKRIPFPVVIGQCLPKGLSGTNTTPAREATFADLDNIDVLYIPGAPSANDTQVGDSVKDANLSREVASADPGEQGSKNAKDNYRKWKEHVSRAPYELKLIEIAKTRGIPVLAICAGSWRLLESFGGQCRTIKVEIRNQHKASSGPAFDLRHDLEITTQTHLSKAGHLEPKTGKNWPKMETNKEDGSLKPVASTTVRMTDANSTHWASADVNQHGKLVQRSPRTGETLKFMPNPGTLLTTSAKSGSIIEAFETVMGVPMMGIQWHPECYVPDMPFPCKTSPEVECTSLGIFEFMVYVAVASKVRRGFVVATLDLERTAFTMLCDYTRRMIREGASMTWEVRDALHNECLKKVATLLPNHALWSLRIDSLEYGLRTMIDDPEPSVARAILSQQGVTA